MDAKNLNNISNLRVKDVREKEIEVIFETELSFTEYINILQKYRKNSTSYGFTIGSELKTATLYEEPNCPSKYILPISSYFNISVDTVESAYRFSASYYEEFGIEDRDRSYIADAAVILQMYSDIDENKFFTTVSENEKVTFQELENYESKLLNNLEHATENSKENEDENSMLDW